MSNAANTITINGQDYPVMPLNWKQLKDRREDIIVINGLNSAATMFTDDQSSAIARVILASLQRSRADLSLEFVETWLDLGNVTELLQMVFGVKKGGHIGGDGEGKVEAATSQS